MRARKLFVKFQRATPILEYLDGSRPSDCRLRSISGHRAKFIDDTRPRAQIAHVPVSADAGFLYSPRAGGAGFTGLNTLVMRI